MVESQTNLKLTYWTCIKKVKSTKRAIKKVLYILHILHLLKTVISKTTKKKTELSEPQLRIATNYKQDIAKNQSQLTTTKGLTEKYFASHMYQHLYTKKIITPTTKKIIAENLFR